MDIKLHHNASQILRREVHDKVKFKDYFDKQQIPPGYNLILSYLFIEDEMNITHLMADRKIGRTSQG